MRCFIFLVLFALSVSFVSAASVSVCDDVPAFLEDACLADLDKNDDNIRLKLRLSDNKEQYGIINTAGREFYGLEKFFVKLDAVGLTHVDLNVNGYPLTMQVLDYEEIDDFAVSLYSIDYENKLAFVVVRFIGSHSDSKVNIDYRSSTVRTKKFVKNTGGGYPFMFGQDRFDGIVVVGDSAPGSDVVAAADITQYLQTVFPDTLPGTTKLASEVRSFRDMIVVGRPCNNPVTERVTGVSACDMALQPDQGFIGFYSINGYDQVVVSGHSDHDVRVAARALADWPNIQGSSFIVEGSLDNPIVRSGSLPLQDWKDSVGVVVNESEHVEDALADSVIDPPSFPEQDTVKLALSKGWNLVSLPGALIRFLENDCAKKPAAFVFLEDSDEYVSLKRASELLGKEFNSYVANNAFWIYSYDDCVQKVIVDRTFKREITIDSGWNLVPAVEGVAKACSSCSQFWWDADAQDWSADEILAPNAGMLVRRR